MCDYLSIRLRRKANRTENRRRHRIEYRVSRKSAHQLASEGVSYDTAQEAERLRSLKRHEFLREGVGGIPLLTKEEWEFLEIPVNENEMKILKMIHKSWENVAYTYNENLSLLSFMKMKRSV